MMALQGSPLFYLSAKHRMTLKPIIISALYSIVIFAGYAQEVWSPDNGDGSFTNPIMWGDWPDPDIIRVDDDFYFVSTSMHYVPGCPIARSRDLVNWEMVGYAVDRYDEDPRYDLLGGNMYLRGSWANSIRYHDGKFYVAFCTPNWDNEAGHFSICEATDPAGPWSRTIFTDYLYDPGLFFDEDGSAYVVHGQGKLMLSRLSDDLHSTVGEPIVIWNERFDRERNLGGFYGMEGSHMYKINGRYYITCPAGGTEGWQVCLRADSIAGPYEYKIIMDDDSSYPGNGLHQGGMVQLRNGDWWFIIMQDRGPIGRVPHLVPVKWSDGWPMLGDNGKDLITYPKPSVEVDCPIMTPATSDEFDCNRLGLQWQWNHNPDTTRWSLSDRPGYLRLTASTAHDLKDARNTLTQRVQGPQSQGTVCMEIGALRNGNISGLGIFQFPYAYVAVKRCDGHDVIVMNNDGTDIETIDLDDNTDKVWFRTRITDRDFKAYFYYSVDGKEFHRIGDTLKMGLGLDWTANRFALFNFSVSPDGEGGNADFDWFHFSPR